MAVLTKLAIDEFTHPIQALAPGASQTLAMTTTTAPVAARITAGTQVIRLVCDADCFIAIGTFGSVSAAASFTRLPAGVAEYFRVPMKGADGTTPIDTGTGVGVAARTVTGTGNLYMTEMY